MKSGGRPRVGILSLLAVLQFASLLSSSTFVVEGKSEREILLQFYDDAGGGRWKLHNGWRQSYLETDTTIPICSWHGISCVNGSPGDDVGVTDIALDNNFLSGEISKEIWHLPTLRYFTMNNNYLESAGFEGFKENLSEVQIIELNSNLISDVTGIEHAPRSLRYLYLNGNEIHGEFPAGFVEVPNLRKLHLSYNSLNGELPTEIGRMSQLLELYLMGNDLKGTIPTEIGLLNKIEVLTLAENRFVGEIPTEVGNMVNLQILSVHNDVLRKGAISGPLPPLENLVYLTSLLLDGNELTGPIPENLLKYSNVTDQDVTIGLSRNRLTGTVPVSLTKFKSLFLNLVGNAFTKLPFKFCNQDFWMNGLVEKFHCDAILCPIGTANPKGRRESADDVCRPCDGNGEYLGSFVCNADIDTATDQVYGLAALYTNTDSSKWKTKGGWDILDDVGDDDGYYYVYDSAMETYCQFYGVECDTNGIVIKISLPNNGLHGEIPIAFFSKLSGLEHLDLKGNNILFPDWDYGFAGIEVADSLVSLDVSDTGIRSFGGISKATNLQELRADDLSITATSSLDEVFELVNLRVFSARFSSMSGNLSGKVGNLINLERLHLYGNNFTGEIPKKIKSMLALKVLDLAENSFEGQIPEDLGTLPNLEILNIHQSDRSNGGLTGILPAFESLTKIRKLLLDSNSIGGKIPDNFLEGVLDKNQEIEVGLSYNHLTGALPESLAAFKNMKIDLVNNKIDYIPSVLCDSDHENWMSGEVGLVGKCDAILCPSGTYNAFGVASSSLAANCIDCPTNQYWGTTYCEQQLVSEQSILQDIFISTNGNSWKSYSNWAVPGNSVCDYEGVLCDDDKVTSIELPNHELSGTISSAIWQIENLRKLILNDNTVTLDFEGINNAQKLEVLKISNTKIKSLEGLEQAGSSLRELYLSRNDFTGAIPTQILSLSNLEVLYLNFNHFSGPLPSEIKNMTKLKIFECFKCDFGGALQSSFGDLQHLEVLNLGSNMLSGFIPTSIGNLPNLKRLNLGDQRGGFSFSGPLYDFKNNTALVNLDLSGNHLSGEIPQSFLSGLYGSEGIVTVDLSNNLLTGEIPSELKAIDRLNVLLADNMIENLPTSFCDEVADTWMNDKVKEERDSGGNVCDAILCSPGKFSDTGNSPCSSCPNEASSEFYGSTNCTIKVKEQISEKIALINLYEALNGTQWIKQKNWLSFEPICSWFGVGCESGHVVALRLSNNNMACGGNMAFTEEVFSLPHLRRIDFASNKVQFGFNNISKAQNLEILDLSSTGLRSLDGIGNAPKLKHLHVADNLLRGPIPDEVFKLTGLKSLHISYNSFTGSLEGGKIEKLPLLEDFRGSHNVLTGEIPTELGKLTKLKYLDLGRNEFDSTLPTELGSLKKLQQLSLYDQLGSFKIHGKLPSLNNLNELTTLELQRNELSGSIPLNFFSDSNVQSGTIMINLGFNDLTGIIPNTFKSFDSLNLDIIGNKFEEFQGGFCENTDSISSWMDGDVGSYGCNAIACQQGTYSSTGRQSNDISCEKCYDLEDQPIIGSASCSDSSTEKGVLKALYRKLGGKAWSKQENWMDDSKPICSWEGVYCEYGLDTDNAGISTLQLENAGLVGAVPSVIFDLPWLERLLLKNNAISITFSNIGSAEKLETLYLSNTNVESLDELSKAKKLKVLHVTESKLHGPLTEVFDIPSLESIYIAFNAFSGRISPQIGSLSNLKYFYAYQNDFTGPIPTEIGNLKQLKDFVIAENLISGQLPSELGALPNLRLFSAYRRMRSGPKLSGTLPAFNHTPSLTDLYLDYNNIGGQIPTNFIAASKGISLVTLSHNLLTGEVPIELDGSFESLRIELEANQISNLPNDFCDNDAWMDGKVAEFQCDAILCKPGYASTYGRANSTEFQCNKCDDPAGAKYWGSTSCEVELSEINILEKLYDDCGGDGWLNKDKWKSSNHVCDWKGILCNEQKHVTGILLEENGLTGQPPMDIFDLNHLQKLWLFGNDISFSFDKIGNARELTEVLLSKIDMISLDGIAEATTIKLLDLSSNELSGTFPEDLLALQNLEILIMENNFFTGSLPNSFKGMNNLEELQLKSNQFTGAVPSFENEISLRKIDLSDNKLEGMISPNFLLQVPSNAEIVIDLSSNEISGVVPLKLDRFSHLTILLQGNKITQLPEKLCDENNEKWNAEAVGKFNCNGILCPPGSFRPVFGRQASSNEPCLSCDSSVFFGEVSCLATVSTSTANARSSFELFFISISAGVVILLLGYQN